MLGGVVCAWRSSVCIEEWCRLCVHRGVGPLTLWRMRLCAQIRAPREDVEEKLASKKRGGGGKAQQMGAKGR